MRTLDEKEVTILTLLAANPERFRDEALEFFGKSRNTDALAIAKSLLGDTSDPEAAEAAETIKRWTQQSRRVPVASAA